MIFRGIAMSEVEFIVQRMSNKANKSIDITDQIKFQSLLTSSLGVFLLCLRYKSSHVLN